jgi:hypothetical protein
VAETMRVSMGMAPRPPTPLDPAILQHAQQLDLHVVRHVADLVEKQGAAVGFLEAPRALDMGAGEAAFFMAEQFGFDEVAGNGAAIDGDAGGPGARAGGVDGARDHFLAAAGRAGDDHGGIGGADLRDLGAHFAHHRAVADQERGDGVVRCRGAGLRTGHVVKLPPDVQATDEVKWLMRL